METYPGQRPGQRPGGRHGARHQRQPVGRNTRRALAAPRRQQTQDPTSPSANGLSSNVITALCRAPKGTLLIGTQDHGWNLWNGQRFSARARNGAAFDHHSCDSRRRDAIISGLPQATASPAATCECLAAVPTGWSSAPLTVYAAARLATNSHPSAWRSRDGLLWFATPKGLVGRSGAFPGEPGARRPWPSCVSLWTIVDQPLRARRLHQGARRAITTSNSTTPD